MEKQRILNIVSECVCL